MRRVLDTYDPAVVVLAHAVAEGGEAAPRIQPLIQSSRVSSDLVDAIVAAERTDSTLLLFECLPTAEPEQQRRGLALLNRTAAPPHAAMIDIVHRLARHRDAAVRAEAIVVVSRADARRAAMRQLIGALDDPDGRVRRRAAEALYRFGDRAAALLRHRLDELTPASLEAVRVLAHVGSPRARRVLAACFDKLGQDAARTAQLLDWIEGSSDWACWSALELCLRDHQDRMVESVVNALAPVIEARLARRLRTALRDADQRERAGAFELIAAIPASRLPPGTVTLLRRILFGQDIGAARPAAWSEAPIRALAEAMASMSPWVRRAARLGLKALSGSEGQELAACAPTPPDRGVPGGSHMWSDDQEFERVVALKRMPLFRYVPFETVAAVARAVRLRTYVAGEQVVADGAVLQDLMILEAGALSIDSEGTPTLTAPACFGEAALVGERMPWPRITASADARVSFLRAAIFEELCREHPEMAIELCRLLARRLRAAGVSP